MIEPTYNKMQTLRLNNVVLAVVTRVGVTHAISNRVSSLNNWASKPNLFLKGWHPCFSYGATNLRVC